VLLVPDFNALKKSSDNSESDGLLEI
jgi:hypothetical protein